MPLKRVLLELKKYGQELSNAAQLAFVLMAAKVEDNSRLTKEFLVFNVLNEWVSLAKFEYFHFKNVSFVDQEAILNIDSYKGLLEILKISDAKKMYFEFANQRIIAEPFIEKGIFYCTPLRSFAVGEDSDKKQLELLDICYRKW